MFGIEDQLKLKVVGDAQIAPGGGAVLYTVSENGTPKGERSPESRIWTQRLDGSAAQQVTFGPNSDRQPRWLPDGASITFLSDRQERGKPQIYLLDGSPRDARRLTDNPSGVTEHYWSPAGDRIAFTTSDFVPEQDNDVKLFDTDRQFRRLHICDNKGESIVPINHGDLHVWEFCWSPDGKSIAAIVSDEPFEWGWYDARLVTIDVASGDVSPLYEPERQIARPAWSPDGSQIALITCCWSDPGMTGGDLIAVHVSDGNVQNLTDGEPRSHHTAHWKADSSGLVTVGLERAQAQICDVDLQSGSTPRWTDSVALSDYGGTFDPVSGKVALTGSTFTRPPEVMVADLSGESSIIVVTQTNEIDAFPEVSTSLIRWQSTDGTMIEGWYLAPEGHDSVAAPPMVTLIHGGPTGAAMASFPLAGATSWAPFLLQQGVAVFMPNFRGSNGYGVKFAEANIGDLGGMDLQDVLTGVDYCVGQGLADGSRLGVGGWSYGGYLTAWAITQTPRFAAAVAGASITNWYSFHGGSNIPGFDGQFIGAAPDELDSPYSWTSPLFACKNVRTPTLFVHGEQDLCCPVGQAYEMTRALRLRGVVAECAIYPREGHGFIEKEHRKDMVERSVGWFSRYLDAQ